MFAEHKRQLMVLVEGIVDRGHSYHVWPCWYSNCFHGSHLGGTT